MVQVLEEVPSFGSQFARSLGGGFSHGVSQGIDYATKLKYATKLEEAKQGLLRKKAEATFTSPQTSNQQSVKPTSSENQTILSPEQIRSKGEMIAQERTQRGLPTSREEGISLAHQENQDLANYQQAQYQVGQQISNSLTDYYPEASDEMKNVLKAKGEEIFKENLSPAQRDKKFGNEVKNMKNLIHRIENGITPNNFFSKAKRTLLGSSKKDEQIQTSMRNKIQPLLDMGLVDEARTLLEKKGYQPEERENLVSNLGEIPKKIVSLVPNFRKETDIFDKRNKPFSPEEKQQFHGYLEDILKFDPATNLILLRREFEKKGVPWNEFGSAVNEMIANKQLKLNPSQENMLEYLDEPPLDNLYKILHGTGFIGR